MDVNAIGVGNADMGEDKREERKGHGCRKKTMFKPFGGSAAWE